MKDENKRSFAAINRSDVIRSAVTTLCLFLILTTAGCGNGGDQGKDTAMGRYVESLTDLPGAEEGMAEIALLATPDKRLEYYAVNRDTQTYARYISEDGKSWEKEALNWSFTKQDENVNTFRYGSDGTLYIQTTYMEGPDLRSDVYRQAESGSLEQLNISWQPVSNIASTLIQGMGILENGDFIFQQTGLGITRYGKEGRFSGTMGSIRLERFVTIGNEVYVIDQDAGGVAVFDGINGEPLRTVPFENLSGYTDIGAGADGAIYLYNQSGIFRLVKEGDVWEKLVDGDLTSLSVPSLYFSGFVEGENKDFYLLCGAGMKNSQLAIYHYDPSIATLPEKELQVFTLYENKTLRQAAALFQRKNPDTKINIQVAMGEGGATESDLNRSLNTELLQGNGPDVLILDGLPVDSYIEKGVLADLSDVLIYVEKNNKLIDAAKDTYKTKDGLWALPTRFSMPILFTDIGSGAGMTDLRAMADFAENHPDKGLFGDRSPKRLMQILLPASAPAWLRGSEIDQEGLKEFLEQAKRIAQVSAPNYPVSEDAQMKNGLSQMGAARIGSISDRDAENDDLHHWAFGRSHAAVKTLNGMNDLTMPSMAMDNVSNAMMMTLPSQAENVYIPTGIVGINGKSDQLESGKALVEILLSDSVQGVELYNGFPVSEPALETLSHTYEEGIYISGGNRFDENESLDGQLPSDERGKQLMELCLMAKTPAMTDSVLMDLIIGQAEGYFTGEKDVDQTIADIMEKTKLYLSE